MINSILSYSVFVVFFYLYTRKYVTSTRKCKLRMYLTYVYCTTYEVHSYEKYTHLHIRLCTYVYVHTSIIYITRTCEIN